LWSWWRKGSSSTTAVSSASQNSSATTTAAQILPQYAPPPVRTAYSVAPAAQANDASTSDNQFALLDQPPATNQYGGQKSCPVTGNPLGSMGPPVAVTCNGKTIYLCCQGCLQKFQSNCSVYADIAEFETNPNRDHSDAGPVYCCSSGCSSCGCCGAGH
jgi:hypothetical protein